MKKTLIALAALATAGVASAQSSVTLFGVVDLSYENVHTAAGRVSGLAPSANSSSRLGFRGVEDLGGGMSASFWLEAALAPQSGISSSGTTGNNQNTPAAGATTLFSGATAGGLTFNRRSTVSLSGGFGEIRLGRDYTPTFWNYTIFDPFGTNSVGATLPAYTGLVSPTFVRASNSIGYFLPGNLGGIYGQLMYAMGNRVSNECAGTAVNGFPACANATPAAVYGYTSAVDTSGNGRYFGGRLGYSQGPINVAASYGKTKYQPGTLAISNLLGASFAGNVAVAAAPPALAIPASSVAVAGGSFTDWSLGGSYTFGSVKAMAYYSRQRVDDVSATGTGVFAPAPVAPPTPTLTGSRPFTFGGFGNSLTYRGWGLGVDWGIGAGNVLASYSRVRGETGPFSESASKWAIGYVHNLSKRTAIYGIYSRVNNSEFAAMNAGSYSSGALGAVAPGVSATNPDASGNLGGSSYGMNIGLRHAF